MRTWFRLNFLVLWGIGALLVWISLSPAPWIASSWGRTNPYMLGSLDLIKSYLIGPYNFDENDGTDISGYGSWLGDVTDDLEIDTAQAQAGTASFLLDNGGGDEFVYHTHTGIASGKYCIKYYARMSTNDTTDVTLPVPSEGVYVWGNNNWPTILRINNTQIEYYDSEGIWQPSGAQWGDTNFHEIEIELDMTNDTFDIWLDDNPTTDDAAFRNTGAAADTPDRITSYDDGNIDSWIDELEVYSGARVP